MGDLKKISVKQVSFFDFQKLYVLVQKRDQNIYFASEIRDKKISIAFLLKRRNARYQYMYMHRFKYIYKQKIQRKIVNIFLPINFKICFGCSKELSH